MTDQHDFAIRQHPDYHKNAECPMCRVKFMVHYLDIFQANDQPICELCAWEKAAARAGALLKNSQMK